MISFRIKPSDDEPNGDRERWTSFLLDVTDRLRRQGTLGKNQTLPPQSHEFVSVTAGTVKPGEPAEIRLTRYGVIVNDEQGAAVYSPDGSMQLIRADGTVEITDPVWTRIEIADMRLVVSYTINRVFGTESHSVEFSGGGWFSCTFSEERKVMESISRQISSNYRFEDCVLCLLGTATPPPFSAGRANA